VKKSFTSTITLICALGSTTSIAEVKAPAAFTANCLVCHAPDTELVGPSLIEIAKLYPEKKSKDFIAWCIKPGRKRPDMPVMPAQAHIPKEQLKEIHAYIVATSSGKSARVKQKEDLFKKSPSSNKRPRITRTFLPKTGPASMLIALPTASKHNFIWDTDLCELRYISTGEIDNFPYLKSNGNSLAKPGKTILTSSPLFDSSSKKQFKGYSIDPGGFPTLNYTIDGVSYTESYTAISDIVTRTIKSSVDTTQLAAPKGNNKLEISTKNSNKTFTIIYKPL